jgi:hypothetical protein
MKVKADLEIKMKRFCSGALALALGILAVGCQEASAPLSAPTVTLPPDNFDPGVDAGWNNVKQGDATQLASLKTRNAGIHGQSFAPRNDPFALLAEERSFHLNQSSERVLAEGNGFRFDYEEPAPPAATEINEPQPYRRLAGVIVGESVLALIDMGDGRPLEIIRPGQRIPNSEWTVVSIDEEKAILRRSGNRLPRQIVVRLESPPFNPNQGGGGGAPGGPPGFGGGGGTPGRPGGGRPGVGPGGDPGLGGPDGD